MRHRHLFVVDTLKQGNQHSTRKNRKIIKKKKKVIVEGDKLSNSPRRNLVKRKKNESNSMQHCCSEVRDVNMVSPETLLTDDGRARSIVLAFEIHICWKVLKKKTR